MTEIKMTSKYDVSIIGFGEIGKPLGQLLAGRFSVYPMDPKVYPEYTGDQITCNFLHICIPGSLDNFNEIVLEYIEKFEPKYTIIHSTVIPGTTRAIEELVKKYSKEESQETCKVVFSPVQGKHADNKMKREMLNYPKYLGATSLEIAQTVKVHLGEIGFDVLIMNNPEEAEWSKIVATSYFGLMISWAQEMERLCDKHELDYNCITHFFPLADDFTPPHIPGIIRGHCVIQNLDLWEKVGKSDFVDLIRKSNELKIDREEDKDKTNPVKIEPLKDPTGNKKLLSEAKVLTDKLEALGKAVDKARLEV